MAATDALCRSFLDLWWHFDPSRSTAGRLADFSPEAIRQHVAALRSLATATEELYLEDIPDEIDRTALLDHLRVLLFRFEHEHPYRTNPLLWTEHLARCFSRTRRSPEGELEAAAALERLRALPAFCRSAQESIRKPPVLLAQAAIGRLGWLATLVDGLRRRFEPRWSQEIDSAALVAEAQTSLGELRAALEDQILPDEDPHAGAIGEAEVDRRLHYEHASIHNAGEVWRGALRLAAEIEQEVSALAAAIDASRPWREVYQSVAGDEIPAPRRESELALWIERAGAFLEQRAIVPPGIFSPLLIEPLGEPDHVMNGWAEYRSDPDDAAIGLGPVPQGTLPWIAVRFGRPGDHLLATVAESLPGQVRRYISASSTTEGWGLYAQELMAELGFASSPDSRLIERVLFLRDVHLALVDIGLHTRQLTTDEAIGHLSQRIPFSRSVASADVRRLLSEPLAACAAILGRQELRRLREDYEISRGDGFTLAVFHEELFQYGGLPIPLIRWGMGLDG